MISLNSELRSRSTNCDGIIHRWKVKSGVNYVQVYEDDDFVEVNHLDDLTELGIKIS